MRSGIGADHALVMEHVEQIIRLVDQHPEEPAMMPWILGYLAEHGPRRIDLMVIDRDTDTPVDAVRLAGSKWLDEVRRALGQRGRDTEGLLGALERVVDALGVEMYGARVGLS